MLHRPLTSPETNADIIHEIADVKTAENESRFILMGSLGRGALLGTDTLDLTSSDRYRFRDVDVIDRAGQLDKHYSFLDGTLDAGFTRSLRPTGAPGEWGFYDLTEPITDSPTPLALFDETDLELHSIPFSRRYADNRVTTVGCGAMTLLSNLHAYDLDMPKHRDQIELIGQCAHHQYPSSLLEAYTTYNEEMQRRHPSHLYNRARRVFFTIAPKLALRAQATSIGYITRSFRKTQRPSDDVLTLTELQTKVSRITQAP